MPPRRSSSPAREEEQSPLLCSPRLWCHKVPIFKTKGAFLVLLWGFSALFVYYYLGNTNFSHKLTLFDKISFSSAVLAYMGMLICPLFGWLADVHYGRYKVIKCSLWAVWLVSVLNCLVSVVLKLLEAYGAVSGTNTDTIKMVTDIVLNVGFAIGLGSFQANIVQFGVDQLLDASSGEIISFIRWYGWLYFLSSVMEKMVHTCLYHSYEVILTLVVPAFLGIMLCLDHFCANWLVKEQVSINPVVMIFQVLRYAVKNKYPRLRSAFSYWDDKRYSRIDLAKTKFGGPFTARQVEDVKMFWHILLILSVGSFFASVIIHIDVVKHKLKHHFRGDEFRESKLCSWWFFLEESGKCFVIVFIPLYEFLLPLFKIHVKLSLLKKFALGMFFILLAVGSYGILETVGHYKNQNANYSNTTCLLDLTTFQADSVLSLSYAWTIFPDVMYSAGHYLTIIVAGEFLFAQSPNSMKGLLFGYMYGMIGLSTVINLAWLIPVRNASRKWSHGIRLGCGTFYFASLFVVILVVVLVFCCITKYYRNRLRDEDQLSEEILNVEDYSQNQ